MPVVLNPFGIGRMPNMKDSDDCFGWHRCCGYIGSAFEVPFHAQFMNRKFS
jgi:hypothetical protein